MTAGAALLLTDPTGVAIFAASGAAKGLDLFGVRAYRRAGPVRGRARPVHRLTEPGLPPVGACLIGTLTELGGGRPVPEMTGRRSGAGTV